MTNRTKSKFTSHCRIAAKTNFLVLLLFLTCFAHARYSSRMIDRFLNWGDHGKPKSGKIKGRCQPPLPGTFTRTTAASTSRPAKSRKRPHDPTRRDSGFFLKDVMLLPSPSVTKIPRGKLRETLHMEGYAASAVEFCSDWSERKLRSALEAVFKDRLDGLPAPMFHFVRGIGDILVRPTLQPSQDFSAKVVKLLAKQGPIYIRAVQNIGSWRWKEDEENTDTDEENSTTSFSQKLATDSQTNLDNVINDSDDDSGHPTEIKKIKTSSSQNETNSPHPVAGPSSELTEGEKLMQLTEMFPSHTREELEGALAAHKTVTLTALALSTTVTDDCSDNEIDLMRPTFLPRKDKEVTLQDVLDQLQGNFSADKEKLKVDQDDILNDALAYYKDSKFDPKKKVRVIYKGQPAADTGGVTRQFYTQLLQEISQQFFHGDTFKTPIYNSNMVVSGIMKLVGTIIVHSILQGGPGFPVFSPSVFFYLATGDVDASVQRISVNDCSIPTKHFIDKVSRASDVSTLDAEEITSILSECGLNVTLTDSNKIMTLQGIIVHDVLGRPKIVLDQVREGLAVLTFGRKMNRYPELFQKLFVPQDKEFSAEDVIRVLDFPKTVNADEAIIENYLVEFLQIASLETLKQFLVFATGAPCLPNFGLGKIEIKYENVTSIFASTCLKSITFPQKFPDKVTFSCSVEAVLSSTTTSFNCV